MTIPQEQELETLQKELVEAYNSFEEKHVASFGQKNIEKLKHMACSVIAVLGDTERLKSKPVLREKIINNTKKLIHLFQNPKDFA